MIQRFKEGKTFIDALGFAEMKAFLEHVDPHYVPYFSTAFLTGMRPNEMLALKWLHVDFDMRCITIREGRVQGIEGPPKTLSSYRDIDMLEPLYAGPAAAPGRLPARRIHVFTEQARQPAGGRQPAQQGLVSGAKKSEARKRTMYQTRHTFASLMLSHGEDPLWVARMLGHTTLQMVFRHYGKFIRNRVRKDGARFLKGLRGGRKWPLREVQLYTQFRPQNRSPRGLANIRNLMESRLRHNLGTNADFGKKRGYGFP